LNLHIDLQSRIGYLKINNSIISEISFNGNSATNVVCFSQTLQMIHSMDGKLVFTYHGQKHLKVGKWTPGIDFAKLANGRLIKLVVKKITF